MKTIATLLFLAALTGCATTKSPVTAAPRALPAEAMRPCPKPAPLGLDDQDMLGLANKLAELKTLLSLCAKDKDTLSDWIKRGQ
jgi:predicted secreted protein